MWCNLLLSSFNHVNTTALSEATKPMQPNRCLHCAAFQLYGTAGVLLIEKANPGRISVACSFPFPVPPPPCLCPFNITCSHVLFHQYPCKIVPVVPLQFVESCVSMPVFAHRNYLCFSVSLFLMCVLFWEEFRVMLLA